MANYKFIGGDGKEYGPFSAEQMRDFLAQNRLTAQSQVSADGGPMQPAANYPEIVGGSSAGIGTAVPAPAPAVSVPAPAPAVSVPPPGAAPAPAPAPAPQPHGQPSHQPYPQNAAAPVGSQANSMALAGMICGIVSLVMLCCCYGLPFNILGIVFSIIGLNKANKTPNKDGKGMAIAGLICSGISILAAIAFLVLGVAVNLGNL